MQLTDKTVTVVGLARSGAGAANILSELGASVTVTDMKSQKELSDSIRKLLPSVKLSLGGHPEELFTESDLIVMSPGVLSDISPVISARNRGIPVIGELELAYKILNNKDFRENILPGWKIAPFIAITGSNGKSTTTTLLNYMLNKAGFRTVLAGNIGNALTEEIYKKIKDKEAKDRIISDTDFIVVEVSSFQLETIDTFRPHIASILNITPDHMDRYHSMEKYINAKARIFENQNNGDYLVLNADDPETVKLYNSRFNIQDSKLPTVCFFSRLHEVKGIYCKGKEIFCNFNKLNADSIPVTLISTEEIYIKGIHNLENAMAASAMALLAGCPVEAVRDALREFRGLEHRLEFVRELEGVRYINDSKGTNVGAVMKSLGSFNENIILIAGGRDKAGDFTAMADLVAQKVKLLVLIGEAAPKIKDALAHLTEIYMARDLKEAVHICRDHAKQGDVVLLSPACASFDMFKDFEDRGRQFKKIVMELKEK